MNKEIKLIYTPRERIPLGEAVVLPDGSYAIRVKRKRRCGAVTEIVTLSRLREMVVQDSCKPTG